MGARGSAAVAGPYHLDFTPLLDAAILEPTQRIIEGDVVATWPQVGPPVVITMLDLTTFTEPSVRASADVWSSERAR